MKIVSRINSRSAVMLVFAALALLVVSGCGDKKEDSVAVKPAPGGETGATGAAALGSTITAEEAKKIEEENFSEEPPPIQTLVGNTTGYEVDEPTVIVAKTRSDFSAMKKKHFSNGVKRQPLAPIEFETRQVVGLFLPKGKKGDVVTITDVHQEGDVIVVSAVKLLPGEDCSVSGPRPRPFHWVETRKMDPDEVKIKLTTQRSSPCLD